MKIKLIASDLDGTLLTDKKELTEVTRKTLDTAIKQGIYFVPATGRCFQAVPEAVRNYPGVEYVITSNGGAIYSVSQKKRVYQCLLKERSVEAILALDIPECVVIEAFLEGIPYSEERYVKDPQAFGATEYGAKYVQQTRHSVKDMPAFVREHKQELDELGFVCGDAGVREAFREELLRSVPDIYITSSIPHLLEIGNCGAGKGKTLAYLLELLGISPEEAMAFGDADNDIDMLSAVKYGVAMGNGSEACKEAAFLVADTNEQDGVAKIVQKYLGLK